MLNVSSHAGTARSSSGVRRIARAAALALLACAACSSSSNADALASEGMAFFRGRMFEAAEERFEGALHLDPTNRAALLGSGGTLVELERAEEARERFARYLELEPRDPDGHVGLARASSMLGRKDDAIASLRAAVDAGLDDLRPLTGDGFEAIRQDIRFVQIIALVAQRAGVRPTDDRGRLIVGGQPVRALDLPSRGGADE